MLRKAFFSLAFAVALALAASCGKASGKLVETSPLINEVLAQEEKPAEEAEKAAAPTASPAPKRERVSFYSSADQELLDGLVEAFQLESGYDVDTFAEEAASCIEKAKLGAADVLFTNFPKAEEAFVAEGFGLGRVEVTQRRFALVGPLSGFEMADNPLEAFAWIGESDLPFCSIEDDWEALQVEAAIWHALDIDPLELSKYERISGGSGGALEKASQLQAYALVDWKTWESYSGGSLVLACGEGEDLVGRFAVVQVNPSVSTAVFGEGGKALADWLVGDEAKRIMEAYGS
jgi:tungstate transport system substrate-binding protein